MGCKSVNQKYTEKAIEASGYKLNPEIIEKLQKLLDIKGIVSEQSLTGNKNKDFLLWIFTTRDNPKDFFQVLKYLA